jgi:hypothetical protein
VAYKPPEPWDKEYTKTSKRGIRFRSAERQAVVLETYSLLKRMVEPSAIVAYLEEHYKLHKASCYRLLAKARKYSLARWNIPKPQLKADLAGYLQVILTSPDASVENRLSALRELCKIMGVYEPERVVNANIDAGAVDPGAAAEMLQAMHRRVLEDDESVALANDLADRLCGAPPPSLEDRMAAHKARGEALLEEHKLRHAGNGNGARPRAGLVEWPPPDSDLPRQDEYGHGEPEPPDHDDQP